MSELQEILDRLDHLSPADQETVQKWIADQKVRRIEQRRNELWGNVCAAIAKYESEIESITIWCRSCGQEGSIDEIEQDVPGYITMS